MFDGPDLIISNVEPGDEGVYTCQVITKLDMVEASSTLTLWGKQPARPDRSRRSNTGYGACINFCCVLLDSLDRPDPPVLLQVTDAKHRAVTLSWTPGDDHNSPILGLVHSPRVQTGVCAACAYMVLFFLN